MTKRAMPKKGDSVSWKSQGKTIQGTVVKKLTQPGNIGSHHVAATKEHPEFLVKSDATGREAAHRAESLHPSS